MSNYRRQWREADELRDVMMEKGIVEKTVTLWVTPDGEEYSYLEDACRNAPPLTKGEYEPIFDQRHIIGYRKTNG